MQITKREFLKKLGLLTVTGAAGSAALKGISPRKLAYSELRQALVKAGCYLG